MGNTYELVVGTYGGDLGRWGEIGGKKMHEKLFKAKHAL